MEAAKKEGRPYNATDKPYSPRKKEEESLPDSQSGGSVANEAEGGQDVAIGAGEAEEESSREGARTLVPWDTETYPALNLEEGCLISEHLARELGEAGALANTWLSGCGLPRELLDGQNGRIENFCAETMRDTAAKLATGHYVDYVDTQNQEKSLRRAIDAAAHLRLKIASCINLASGSQAACLYAHKEHIAVLTSGLRILADGIARDRGLFVTVGRTDLLKVLVEEVRQEHCDEHA